MSHSAPPQYASKLASRHLSSRRSRPMNCSHAAYVCNRAMIPQAWTQCRSHMTLLNVAMLPNSLRRTFCSIACQARRMHMCAWVARASSPSCSSAPRPPMGRKRLSPSTRCCSHFLQRFSTAVHGIALRKSDVDHASAVQSDEVMKRQVLNNFPPDITSAQNTTATLCFSVPWALNRRPTYACIGRAVLTTARAAQALAALSIHAAIAAVAPRCRCRCYCCPLSCSSGVALSVGTQRGPHIVERT